MRATSVMQESVATSMLGSLCLIYGRYRNSAAAAFFRRRVDATTTRFPNVTG